MGRNPNLRSSVYLGKDGSWHGRVSVGVKDDGSPDRRHVRGQTKTAVMAKVKELEKVRDSGRMTRAGSRWTLGEWLEHWLESIARPSLEESSFDAYENAVRVHLIPGLGKHKLTQLKAEHLEQLYRRMIEAGAAPGNAHQVHRTVRTALGVAHRRGHVSHNVASLAKPPRVESVEVVPYSIAEVKAILETAKRGRNSARWAIALGLGLRQGEAVGLRWSDVDFERRSMTVREPAKRAKFVHGCGDSPCGKEHPGWCPQRKRRNKITGKTKSAAGRRTVGVPEELLAMLKAHRAEQNRERLAAGQLWQDGDWVFASPVGKPLNLNTDYHNWRALLKRAGVRVARLHDARHTAATTLLALGVNGRTVMSVMGWSSMSMLARYQHVTDPIRQEVADRIGDLLWGPEAEQQTPTETTTETTEG